VRTTRHDTPHTQHTTLTSVTQAFGIGVEIDSAQVFFVDKED
jgi:hypothetical protein